MILAYSQAPRFEYIWLPGPGLRHLPMLIVPLTFIFLTAGLLTKNPTAVGMEKVSFVCGYDRAARPFVWRTALLIGLLPCGFSSGLRRRRIQFVALKLPAQQSIACVLRIIPCRG